MCACNGGALRCQMGIALGLISTCWRRVWWQLRLWWPLQMMEEYTAADLRKKKEKENSYENVFNSSSTIKCNNDKLQVCNGRKTNGLIYHRSQALESCVPLSGQKCGGLSRRGVDWLTRLPQARCIWAPSVRCGSSSKEMTLVLE